ncbi:hypothetical protein BLA18112_02116 [Burkholderia lata]|uniref:Uncharacterized protein n=1 Tax=Burkholderia lata (strain ATCC 17760 / DSM 23089 / LMG 22485 / NCIMB 9086 / R18194 / 383) TaxID=482957 RepID=A0A6P2V1B9_BURL3|nr:hypothetical protein BLA18112_02116 [Burkholderia lata]
MPTPDLDKSLLDAWAAGLTATTRKALLAQIRSITFNVVSTRYGIRQTALTRIREVTN